MRQYFEKDHKGYCFSVTKEIKADLKAHTCGTTACIGGWAIYLAGFPRIHAGDVCIWFADRYSISGDESYFLLMGHFTFC